jgi:hypothetical protein
VGSAAQGTTRTVFGSAFKHDVDVRRIHRALIFRVVAGDRLQKNRLGQPHALFFGEFFRGHELAARHAGHVRDDGFDFRNAVFLQELLNRARHKSPCAGALRLASPNAANNARENGFFGKLPFRMPLHTQARSSAPATRNASITPSGARASTRQIPAQCFDSLPMQRIDLQALASGDFLQGSSRLQQNLVRGSVLHIERAGFILAVIE